MDEFRLALFSRRSGGFQSGVPASTWFTDCVGKLVLGLSLMTGGTVAAGGPGGIGPQPNASRLATGLVLTASPRPGAHVQVLDLASGRGTDLPRSERARLRDLRETGWYVSRSTRELLREDGSEKVDIFSWPGLALKASFKLDSEHGASGRGELLRLRMSADGQRIAALEFVMGARHKNRVLVFNRQGQVLLAGPYQEAEGDGGGFEWLPDGRLLYFSKGQLKIHDLATGESRALPVQYPADVLSGHEDLAVSPDGQSLAITKVVRVRNSRGEARELPAIFRVGAGGGQAVLLAHPSQARLDDPLRLSLMDLSWSADGHWLSFLAELGHDRWGSGLGGGGCPNAYAVPAGAPGPVPIDGFADKDRMLHQPDGRGGRVPLRSCAMLRWF